MRLYENCLPERLSKVVKVAKSDFGARIWVFDYDTELFLFSLPGDTIYTDVIAHIDNYFEEGANNANDRD